MVWMLSPFGIGVIVVLIVVIASLIYLRRAPIKKWFSGRKVGVKIKAGPVEISLDEKEKPKKPESAPAGVGFSGATIRGVAGRDIRRGSAQIFLSYAREDEEKVKKLYQELSDAGFKPWMDIKDILPGERWKSSIRKATRRSDFFLVCLSANSIDKRGWIQKEIKWALNIWQEKLDSDIYLIPVRLEDCEAPEKLRDFQWVDLFEEDGWTLLVKAIQIGVKRRGAPAIVEPTAPAETTMLKEDSERAQELNVRADVLPGFVDRTRELALLRRMLSGETDKRILLITAAREQGKSWLLLWICLECEQQTVPVALLDFDQRRSGLTDYLSVAREVRRCLGDECTPDICACEEAIARIGSISEAGPAADQIAWQKAEMGRALCRDLAGLAAAHRRVVLLVDTFEYPLKDKETCAWLERWLFQSLRRELRHVLLVVAGRPECSPFFDQPSLWGGLVATIDRFDPFSDDDILTHYHQRGLPVSEVETSLLTIARSSPARMAQVGDWLEQTRGGAR